MAQIIIMYIKLLNNYMYIYIMWLKIYNNCKTYVSYVTV